MNSRALSKLLLAVLLCTVWNVWANQAEINDEPDFYESPGLDGKRSYDFGDNLVVDTFGGTLQMHSNDLVASGIGPDIVVQRSYNSVPSVLSDYSYMGPGWDIHFGRIVGRYTCFENELTYQTTKLFFIKPDGSQVQILPHNTFYFDNNRNNQYDEETDYRPTHITADLWRAECRGSSLVITDTQDTDYILGPSDSPDVYAKHVVVRIEDSYGNYLTINYEMANAFSRPTTVSASDGRLVTFGYTDFLLTSVTDGMVTVNYAYTGNHLTSVLMPEDVIWRFGYLNNTRLLSQVISPLKAETIITWNNVNFQNKDYPVVTSKCVVENCWNYSYFRELSSSDGVIDKTVIETPYHTREEYSHLSPLAVENGEIWKIGLLIRKDIYHMADGTIDSTVPNTCPSDTVWLNPDTPIHSYEYTWHQIDYSDATRTYVNNGVYLIDQGYYKPVIKSIDETRYGETFHYEVISYTGGAPEIELHQGNKSRYTKREYASSGSYQGEWLIHLPSGTSVSEYNGDFKFVSGADYNVLGQVVRKIENGAETRFSYHPDGTLHIVTDGAGNQTRYTDYYRGVARRIDFPNASYATRDVDDRGRIVHETNPNFASKTYRYDQLDRVYYINMPETLTVRVTYGLPDDGGMFKRFERGSQVETYEYDLLGNMVQQTQSDSVSGTTLVRKFEYNERNQLSFESNVNQFDKGTHYRYDRLGELTETFTTEGELIRRKPGGLSTTIVDAECNETTHFYDAYASADLQLKQISGPEGLLINISRNVLGQPLTVEQNGMVRAFDYDENWMLSYYKDPESDAQYYYFYDAAGRMIQERAGTPDDYYVVVNAYDEMGRMKSQSYSALYIANKSPWTLFMPEDCGRPASGITCNFDSYQDTFVFDYDDVGNLKSKVKNTTIMRWGWTDQSPRIVEQSTSWTYDYDAENKLMSEELITHDSRVFRLSYDYNDYGYLNTITYPTGHVVGYDPDVLGRATRVGNVISAIQYFDSGAIQSLTYGNGKVASYSLNSRNLTDVLQVNANGSSLVSFKYDYDLNRNIKSIQDRLDASKSRAMIYDGLDRLTNASGPWGVAEYHYDSMSNIVDKTVAGRNYVYQYGMNTNLLTAFDGRSIEYDSYGRITDDGKNRYFYDFSNNLIKATNYIDGRATGYRYDANNRMYRGSNIFSDTYVYSSAGKLMYEEQRKGDLKRSHIYLGSRLVGYQDIQIECTEDLDNDGIPHCYERDNLLNPYYNDSTEDRDGDGLTNLQEFNFGTLAGNADSDGDGISDDLEIQYGLDPLLDDAGQDPDGDGFTNLEEIQQGSNPSEHTDLTPASHFSAKFAAQSVVVTWLPVMHADGYDLYWSNEPFQELTEAQRIENVSSPFIHPVQAGESVRYYRLVTKKGGLRSAPSSRKVAELVDKHWSYLGLVNWYPEQVGMDAAGNVHVLKSVTNSSSEVSYWDSESETMTHYDIFSFTPNRMSLAVAPNGFAMVIASYYTEGSIWVAMFDPRTKSWSASRVQYVNRYTRQISNLSVAASDNGNFAISWVENDYSKYTGWVRGFDQAQGWGASVRLEYSLDSSPYYGHTAGTSVIARINDEGDLAAIWTLKEADATVRSVHLLTLESGGEPVLRSLAELPSVASLRLAINDAGGIALWQPTGGEALSQRFDMTQLIGEPQQLGFTEPRILGLNLSGETATVFASQDDLLQVSSQEGTWAWSVPYVSDIGGYIPDGIRTFKVQDGGIQTILSNDIYRYHNGSIDQIAIPTEYVNPYYLSDITLAGDVAGVSSWNVGQGWPLYVYRSQVLPENELPIAIAGSDIELTSEPVFNLSGDMSTDPDGVIVKYQWTQISGPELMLSDSHTSVAKAYLAGISHAELEFSLTVTDERGGESTDTVLVTVNNPFGPPTAHAGENQAVSERSTVQLSALNSTAASQNPIVGYQWTQIAGPDVVLQNPGTAEASFVAPEVDQTTTLEFSVMAFTGQDHYYEDSANVTITVYNDELPVADFGQDQVVEIGDRVVLDYSNTHDPDGGSISMSFSVVSGGYVQLQGGSAPRTLEFTAPEVTQNTTFVFRLTVTDDEGDTAVDEVSVTVNAPAVVEGPTANAGADQTANAGVIVTLDGSASSAPQGVTISQYQWTQLSGPTVALSGSGSVSPQFTAPQLATTTELVFRLQVTASNGQTASDTVTINVLAATGNQPPVANAGPDQTVNEGDTVILDARGSTDPDGYSLTLSWSVVSGGYVELQQGPEAGTLQFVAPNVAFDTDFVFEVTVTDGNGASSTDQVTITVLNTSTPPPAGECELDFDGNGVVEDKDFYSQNYEGIYYAVYIYLNYNAYYSYYFPNTPVEKLDWNGDGNITIEEVYTGTISQATLHTFQTQHWFYLNNKNAYATYYPDSGCAL